jgi:hypothetical protein
VNERLRAYAVINAADAQGRDNDDALAALRSLEGIEALPFFVVRRNAFPNAFHRRFVRAQATAAGPESGH